MDEGQRSGFACPLALPQEGSSEVLALQNGLMIQFAGRPEVYVLFGNGEWQRVASGWRPGDPELEPPAEPLPEGLYQPTGIFGSVWQEPGLQTELGYALAATPMPFRGVEQRFPGGILLADQDSGVVYPFLASNLRL
jgi:hypothetical protein